MDVNPIAIALAQKGKWLFCKLARNPHTLASVQPSLLNPDKQKKNSIYTNKWKSIKWQFYTLIHFSKTEQIGWVLYEGLSNALEKNDHNKIHFCLLQSQAVESAIWS